MADINELNLKILDKFGKIGKHLRKSISGEYKRQRERIFKKTASDVDAFDKRLDDFDASDKIENWKKADANLNKSLKAMERRSRSFGQKNGYLSGRGRKK